MLLSDLKTLAAVAVANHFDDKGELIDKLDREIPKSLIPDVKRAFNNCWTPRYYRTKIAPCPPWCVCKRDGDLEWRKPMALLEAQKAPKRQLYRRLPSQPVSKKSQQKAKTSNKTVANSKNPKGADKCWGLCCYKKRKGKSNDTSTKRSEKVKNCQNIATKQNCKNQSTSKKKTTKPVPSKKSMAVCDKKSKKDKNADLKAKPKFDKKPTASSSKKEASKKTKVKKEDNVSVRKLKEKVKVMKKKLDTLLETVSLKEKSKKRKPEALKEQEKPTRRSARISAYNGKENVNIPKKKLKISKSNKSFEEEVFEPRPGPSRMPGQVACKKQNKFTKSNQHSPKSNGTKSSKRIIESRVPQVKTTLKRNLRSNVDVPSSKRRRQG